VLGCTHYPMCRGGWVIREMGDHVTLGPAPMELSFAGSKMDFLECSRNCDLLSRMTLRRPGGVASTGDLRRSPTLRPRFLRPNLDGVRLSKSVAARNILDSIS